MAEDKFNTSTSNNLFLSFNCASEKEWTGEFSFIQAADTQFGMQESSIEKKENYGWKQEIAWSRQMVHEVNNMEPRPRFLVICGDLLNEFPESQINIRSEQEKDFKAVFNDLKIPLVCVCGNHDVGNEPSFETIGRYKSSFGDDFFSFWCGGVYFLVLNSQYYENSSRVPKLAAEQEIWLQRRLDEVMILKPKHAVVFQHIPPFLYHPEEEKEYFNFALPNRKKFLDKLYDAGIRHIFTGHYHRNAGGKYKDLEVVVTSAVGAQLGKDKQGYRVVKVGNSKIEHLYHSLAMII